MITAAFEIDVFCRFGLYCTADDLVSAVVVHLKKKVIFFTILNLGIA